MKKQELTEELCSRLRPLRRKAIADTVCRGLVARFGRSGVSFHVWSQGETDARTGKRKRKFVGLGGWSEHGGVRTLTLAQARQRAHEARAREAGMLGDGTTVEEIASSFKRNILSRQERAEETWAVLEQHVLDRSPTPGGAPLSQWVVARVELRHLVLLVEQAKLRRLEARKHERKKRWTGGPITAHRVLMLLRALFRHGKAVGLAVANPAADLSAKELGLRAGEPRTRFLSDEELRIFFSGLDVNGILAGTSEPKASDGSHLALAVLLYTGVRRGALQKALKANVDLSRGEWVVPASDRKLKGHKRQNAGPWVCPLCPTAVALFRKLAKLHLESARVLPVTDDVLQRHLTRLLTPNAEGVKRLQLDPFNVHDLRATWRSTAARLNVRVEVAEKQLDHELQGVLRVYQRDPLLAARHGAVTRVGEHLDALRTGRTAAVVPLAVGVGA